MKFDTEKVTLLGKSTERSGIVDMQLSRFGWETPVGSGPGHMAAGTGPVDSRRLEVVEWQSDRKHVEDSATSSRLVLMHVFESTRVKDLHMPPVPAHPAPPQQVLLEWHPRSKRQPPSSPYVPPTSFSNPM